MGGELGKEAGQTGLSLLFAAGKRPSAADIDRLLSSAEMQGAAAFVSHRPRDDEGWVELLVSGLTFDLIGLSPGEPAPAPPSEHVFGLPDRAASLGYEAISLVPGPHITGGRAMMPVVRAMVSLAATIALPLSVEAVCWHPARSWMEPQYFSRVILNWLSGGVFPALGLTAVEQVEEGFVGSKGLDFFVGQEIQLEAKKGEALAETVKLAVRVIDYMAHNGPLRQPGELEGSGGERLRAEPTRDGKAVWVWRNG